MHTLTHRYIYSHPQTDCFVVSQLISVARHTGCFKLGLKSTQLYIRLSIIPLSHHSTYINSEIIRHYVVAFTCLYFLTEYQCDQFLQRALHCMSGSH